MRLRSENHCAVQWRVRGLLLKRGSECVREREGESLNGVFNLSYYYILYHIIIIDHTTSVESALESAGLYPFIN